LVADALGAEVSLEEAAGLGLIDGTKGASLRTDIPQLSIVGHAATCNEGFERADVVLA
jgi:hypothetical protein